VVRHQPVRLVERKPAAGGYAFRLLGRRGWLRRLHEEKMTNFVNQFSAEAKVPLDAVDGLTHREIGEAGLFGGFAKGRRLGELVALEVAFRKSPVAVAVSNEKHERLPVLDAKHNSAGGGLAACARAHTVIFLTSMVGRPSTVGRPSMNCRTMGSVVC